MTSLHDFTATTLDGREQSLSEYAGRLVLVVNTASQCGFTPQLQGLEELWRRHRDEGLVVLGFPCNQFGGQEPGDAEQIASFCERSYGVSFPMFARVDVNGADAHPLFRWLTAQAGGLVGRRIRWNFTKFLVDPHGQVVSRHAPATPPERIAETLAGHLPVR